MRLSTSTLTPRQVKKQLGVTTPDGPRLVPKVRRKSDKRPQTRAVATETLLPASTTGVFLRPCEGDMVPLSLGTPSPLVRPLAFGTRPSRLFPDQVHTLAGTVRPSTGPRRSVTLATPLLAPLEAIKVPDRRRPSRPTSHRPTPRPLTPLVRRDRAPLPLVPRLPGKGRRPRPSLAFSDDATLVTPRVVGP